MNLTLTADQRAAILAALANVSDEALGHTAFSHLDYHAGPQPEIVEAVAAYCQHVADESKRNVDAGSVNPHDHSNAKSYGDRAEQLRMFLSAKRFADQTNRDTIGALLGKLAPAAPGKVEEGREHHEDGTVVINYTDGSCDEFPPSCRHLVPSAAPALASV